MNVDIYNKVEQFVIDSFTKAGKPGTIRHLQPTAHWVKVLRTDADEAMLCAAVAHDIERAFKKVNTQEMIKSSPQGYKDEHFLKIHQEESANVIAEFLREQLVENDFITRVIRLVSRHEVGGDNDENIIKDADSVSFFECCFDRFVPHWLLMQEKLGGEKVREKFDWMFNRITSEKAKDIARPWYEKALEKLNQMNQS